MKIIVNADDYGYTNGIVDAIVKGHQEGIITSTTVMCNVPDLEYALEKSHLCPDLGFGVHLTLTCGKPLTEAKSLVDENGNFLKYKEYFSKYVDPQEVENEFSAQIERFIELFGFIPTHLDSHQGAHDGVTVLMNKDDNTLHNYDEIYAIAISLAEKYSLPVRRSCEYKWIDSFYGEQATDDKLIEIFDEAAATNTSIEIMVHPGYCDQELLDKSSYNVYREQELLALCSSKVKEHIKSKGYQLVHF